MRIALLVAAVALAACTAHRPAPRAAAKVGRPIVLAAPDLAGNPVDVAADRGRVRVVDFWATWCEPCRDEMPALDRLWREKAAQGLSVYAVSFDEDRSQIPTFLAQVPVGFPVLWDKGGDRWSGAYDVNRLPTMLVVDRRGVIRYAHEGYDRDTAAEARREVEALLAEPVAP